MGLALAATTEHDCTHRGAVERFIGLLAAKAGIRQTAAEPSALEGMATETKLLRKGRSRRLRDLALARARGICAVCRRDFSLILDDAGLRVLQVHHRKQLAASDAPKVTSLSDLSVVCANCHLLIHSDPRRALAVQTVRRRLAASDGSIHGA